jgi:hypothetical protein
MTFDQDEINLRYLANNIYYKNHKNKEDKIINNDDILFYKKRLTKIFKLQLKNYKVNSDLDNIFNDYVSQLIYKFQIEDRNEEIQNNLSNQDIALKNITNSKNDISLNIQLPEQNKLSLTIKTNDNNNKKNDNNNKTNDNYNKIIYNNSQKKGLDAFVINNKQKNVIYPKVKTININTDYYKKKRYKKNNNDKNIII